MGFNIIDSFLTNHTLLISGYGASNLTKDLNKMSVTTPKYSGTLKAYPHFNAEDDAKVLRKAMKGLGELKSW